MRHPLGAVEQLVHVDAHHGAGHHAEVRQRRVAPADRLEAVGDVAKARRFGELLELGARVGDRDEALRGLARAPTASDTRSKKYCSKMFGSSVVPDLLETMKSVRARSISRSRGAHLRGIGRVEHAQLRMARPRAGR